jgi:predicted nucleotidyltransferase
MEPDKKNMDMATEFCDKLRQELKENLVSFTLYGSAIRNDMVPGHSDLNVLIVLEHSSPEAHRAIAEKLRSYPAINPFVLCSNGLERSMMVFALKFSSIRRHHRVLFGADPVADFNPPGEIIRFLCEQSLRNLRLRLKNNYIRNFEKPERYGNVVLKAIPGLFVSLSEVLRSAGIDVPVDHASRPDAIGKALGTDASVLTDLRGLHQKPRRLTADEAFQIHSRIYGLLSEALEWVRKQWPLETDLQ